MPPARLDRALRGDTPKGLEAGVTIVDVRSPAAYEQAHLPGALHIPLEELPERAGELDGNQTIVLYVLSSSESGALQAAMALYELGFTNVAVLEGGIQRWYAEGYVIEGTWLTPTPDEVGPPWTLTPLATEDRGPRDGDADGCCDANGLLYRPATSRSSHADTDCDVDLDAYQDKTHEKGRKLDDGSRNSILNRASF